MDLFFQHVGERGVQDDFPKSIGTEKNGLKSFRLENIQVHLDGLEADDLARLDEKLVQSAPEGFQIWGIPTGAKSVLKNFNTGDGLLLLETISAGGRFGYAGRAIHAINTPQFRLSSHLWGASRYPLIVFHVGSLTDYSWYDFCDEFGYKRNWNPAGNTYRIGNERIASSSRSTADEWLAFLAGPKPALNQQDDHRNSDLHGLSSDSLEFPEGASIIRQHLEFERSSGLVKRFKSDPANSTCSVCGFDFEATYGELGRGFIEAHHIKPISATGPTVSTEADLCAVCSNCHQMLHRRYPALSAHELREIIHAKRQF